jgi:hypothetical protein
MLEFMTLIPALMAFIVQIWALIGLWFIFSCFLNALKFIYVHFVRGGVNLVRRFGKKVILAGHMDSILGWPLALELTRRGHDVVVVAISDGRSTSSSGYPPAATDKKIAVVKIDASWPNCSPEQLNILGKEKILGGMGDDEVGMLVLLPPSPATSAPCTFSSHSADAGLELFTASSAFVWVPTWLVRFTQPHAIISITSCAADIITPQSVLHGALSAFTARLTANLGRSQYAQRLIVVEDCPLGRVSPSRMASLCCDAMGREHVLAPHAVHAIIAWALQDLKMGPWLSWFISWWCQNVQPPKTSKAD